MEKAPRKYALWSVVLVVLYLILSGCGGRTPLPKDLVILPPTANVPAELANFSGGWSGFIRDGQITRNIRVFFMYIGSAEDVKLVYSYASAVSTAHGNKNLADGDYQLLKAKFTKNGEISAKTEGGNVLSFRINADGTLTETFTGSSRPLTTTLKRMPQEEMRALSR